MLQYFQKEAERQKLQKQKQNNAPVLSSKKSGSSGPKSGLSHRQISDIIRRATNLDLTVNRLDYYVGALTHKSFFRQQNMLSACNSVNDIFEQKNNMTQTIVVGTFERPEFLGDSILSLCITEYIYHMFPNADEGFLTKLRSIMVQSDACIRYAKFLGLDKLLQASPETLRKIRANENPKIYEDIFEAFLAAMYLDFNCVAEGIGFYRVRQFLHGLLQRVYGNEKNILGLMQQRDNYKDIILQDFQNCGWPQPRYYDVPTSDVPSEEEKKGRFYQCIYVPSNPKVSSFDICGSHDDPHTFYVVGQNMKMCVGWGDTKKQAQQHASSVALSTLRTMRKRHKLNFRKIEFSFSME